MLRMAKVTKEIKSHLSLTPYLWVSWYMEEKHLPPPA